MKKVNYEPIFWVVGKNFFVRTATYHLTGKLISVGEHEIFFSDACWIADSGRFAQALTSGIFSEVEPFPKGAVVAVGRSSLIDAVQIKNLPTEQK